MRSRRPRRAFTLLEMLIAMAVAMALLGALAATASRLLSSRSSAQAHFQSMNALGELGRQLRRDVHAARGASIENVDGHPRTLRLELGEQGTIVYTLEGDTVVRTAQSATAAQRRERFALPGIRCVNWRDELGTARRVSLVVGRLAVHGAEPQAVSSTFEITAALPTVAQEPQP